MDAAVATHPDADHIGGLDTGVTIFRTDKQGTIMAISDGAEIRRETIK
ncbi:hypothetical protein [Paenibacillus dendritiformis]|nr:hypothetical protein [Paenibacillus dendritiformis]